MTRNKSLQIALIISAIVHGSVIFLPRLNLIPSLRSLKKIELTYLKTIPEDSIKLKRQPLPKRDINPKPARLKWHDYIYKSSPAKPLSSLFTKEKLFKKQDEFLTNKAQLLRPDIIAIKKKIALTPQDANRINNPSYISYYQIVREKIRRCAYQNYTSQDTGEVYLSFVISSDGNLTHAKVIEEKSAANSYLREIAIKSIRDASRFPTFPKDLDYPELSFNVIISFEIE